MAVDFTFNNIVQIIAQEFLGGDTTIAGLSIMLVLSFIMMAILANLRAPVVYSLAPMVILSVAFAAMGFMDPTVSFLIIILCAIVIALQARRIASGD